MDNATHWSWTSNRDLRVAAREGSYGWYELGLSIGECHERSKASAKVEIARRIAAGEMRRPRNP